VDGDLSSGSSLAALIPAEGRAPERGAREHARRFEKPGALAECSRTGIRFDGYALGKFSAPQTGRPGAHKMAGRQTRQALSTFEAED